MICGVGEREEALIPADAEWRIRAILEYEEVVPNGQSSPAVISFPIEIIESGILLDAKLLETSRV